MSDFTCQSKPFKAIGILGGMGPEATAEFYLSIIRQCQEKYGARYDSDYPEIIICSLPVPDMVNGIGKSREIIEYLLRGAKKLEGAGAEFISMPCNTANFFYKKVCKQLKVPFLSITEETAKKANSCGYKTLGLLATETSIMEGVFEKDFKRLGLTLLVPAETRGLNRIILNVMAGKKLKKDKVMLKEIAKKLEKRGAEAIVLGCTELPLLEKNFSIPALDTIEILAEAALRFAKKETI